MSDDLDPFVFATRLEALESALAELRFDEANDGESKGCVVVVHAFFCTSGTADSADCVCVPVEVLPSDSRTAAEILEAVDRTQAIQ